MPDSKNVAVAVVGMCGSGKSVLANHFINDGWACVYFGGVTMKILEEKGLPKTQHYEKQIRENLRKEHGMEAYAKLLYPQINDLLTHQNVVIDGLYSWDEYKYLKERLGDRLIIVAVITNRKIRYKRLHLRPIRPLSEEEAIMRDHHEIENLDKGGPIAIADYYILNNTTLDDLKSRYVCFTSWLNAR